ncbi:MAG TPA: ABC transporter substrate-binding protein [Gaiellaceae bacterium]|nr:ABC transporter substrate-binding protein [Gaiellaceae bacterium]
MTGSGDPAFVKNFNPFTGNTLPSGDLVRGAFYEPLIITTAAGGGHQYPWLAQSWTWSNGNKTLTLNLRHGVKWSDGKPLTSADVVYSLTAGTQDKTMDLIGYTHPDSNIRSIAASGPYKVVIKLKTADSTFIPSTLNAQYIIPKHIWSKVADPATWTNPNPVGSGPFDVIKKFTTQDYVLGKNPHYWLKGAPKVPCLEYTQAASNDAALALIQSGQVDWTHNFVPNAATAYSAKDPQHFHYFYATTAFAQSLVFDDQQYPYSIPAFRKALSLAIDRNSISKLGEYGYAPPVDALGLGGVFPTWYTPALRAAAKAAATYDPAKAKTMLTSAGFTYKGSTLLDPKGNPVKLDIHVISGWSDWVASDQIIAKNLQAIGIDSSEVLEPDWNSWYPNASTTKNPTLLWQNVATGDPYGYFNANLSQAEFTPEGQDATSTSNWAHFYDASVQPILNNWRASLDSKTQHADFVKAANIFLKDQPVVPLFIGPEWSTFSTRYFHGFPTPKNYYTQPIFTQNPDNILAFTRIAPGGKSGE